MTIHYSDTKTPEIEKLIHKEWEIYDKEHFGEIVKWNTKRFYLTAEDNGLVGFLDCRIEAGVAKVDELIIKKGQQRKGIGRSLMEKCEEVAKEMGAHKLFLITGKDWDATKFYESLGYSKTADLPKHYFNADFVEYSKWFE